MIRQKFLIIRSWTMEVVKVPVSEEVIVVEAEDKELHANVVVAAVEVEAEDNEQPANVVVVEVEPEGKELHANL